jgi:hypothetical protein
MVTSRCSCTWSTAAGSAPRVCSTAACCPLGCALYARLRAHYDESTLIEMTQLVGLYTGVAMQVALTRPERDAYERPTAKV